MQSHSPSGPVFNAVGAEDLLSITAALLMLVELNSRNGWQATLLTQ